MDARARLTELEGRYIQLQAGDESICGYLLGVGETLALVAVVHDGVIIGRELVSLRVVSSVRRGVVDEFYEQQLQRAGVLAPSSGGAELSSGGWREAIAVLAQMGVVISVECEPSSDEGRSFLVGRVEEVDDLRLRLRYLTTTANWRELDVVPTRSIERVGFGSRYFELLAAAARPWQSELLAWANELSAAQRERWAPLSQLFEVIGEPVTSMAVQRLCLSHELGETSDYLSPEWGIELCVEGERVDGVLLYGPGHPDVAAFGGFFIEELALSCSREQLHACLGAPHTSEPEGEEWRDHYFLGPLALSFVFLGDQPQELAVVAIALAELNLAP